MQEDDITCEKNPEDGVNVVRAEPAYRPKPEYRRLSKTIDTLEEKFRALNSAIKLYSFAGTMPSNLKKACHNFIFRWSTRT